MPTKLTLSIVLAALLTFALAGTAQAAPTVSNTNDSGPGSLRQAIAEAAPGDTIAVPAGTYSLSSEPLAIERSVSLVGAGPAATIVRSVGPFRAFTISPPATTINVTLSDMMIRDGRVFEGVALGGGILAIKANLTLRRVNVTGNLASANGELSEEKGGTAGGGGVLLVKGALTVAESSVSGNIAEAVGGPKAKGGLVQGGGIAVVNGSFKIEASTIGDNVANAGGGKGPADAKQEGGLAVGAGLLGTPEEAPSSVVASTISGNVAEAPAGPGGKGGEVGGAGFFAVTSKQPIAVSNTTIAANSVRNGSSGGAPGFAAGVFALAGEAGSITFTSTTIAANRLETSTPESQGGNVFAAGGPNAIVFRNSIVANGVGPAGSENCSILGESATGISQGFNLDSLDQCKFKAAGDQVNKDPLLGPLALNGGPTQTMAPAATSPAIDQGAAFGLTADQRGVLRPIDLPSIPNSAAAGADGSDVGAVELQPSNALKLGKLAKNKKKGTATLAVTLPAPSAGLLTLSGKGLKTQKLTIKGQTAIKLKVLAGTKSVRKALSTKGKRKVQIKVTYTPTGNVAATLKRKASLLKKLKKKHG